jgi:hypothetical protein
MRMQLFCRQNKSFETGEEQHHRRPKVPQLSDNPEKHKKEIQQPAEIFRSLGSLHPSFDGCVLK